MKFIDILRKIKVCLNKWTLDECFYVIIVCSLVMTITLYHVTNLSSNTIIFLMFLPCMLMLAILLPCSIYELLKNLKTNCKSKE